VEVPYIVTIQANTTRVVDHGLTKNLNRNRLSN
jgi:hypothetical protein